MLMLLAVPFAPYLRHKVIYTKLSLETYNHYFVSGGDGGCYSGPGSVNGSTQSTVFVTQFVLGSVHPLFHYTAPA